MDSLKEQVLNRLEEAAKGDVIPQETWDKCLANPRLTILTLNQKIDAHVFVSFNRAKKIKSSDTVIIYISNIDLYVVHTLHSGDIVWTDFYTEVIDEQKLHGFEFHPYLIVNTNKKAKFTFWCKPAPKYNLPTQHYLTVNKFISLWLDYTDKPYNCKHTLDYNSNDYFVVTSTDCENDAEQYMVFKKFVKYLGKVEPELVDYIYRSPSYQSSSSYFAYPINHKYMDPDEYHYMQIDYYDTE